MKKLLPLFIVLLLAAFTKATAQSSVMADPGVGLIDLTDMAGNSINANTLLMNVPGKLKLPVYNFSQDKGLPAGSGKIIISLGDKMILDPSFDLSTAPLSNYFTWTSAVVNGEFIITGDLVNDFPEDVYTETVFNVMGKSGCTSMILAHFDVDNHNSTTILNDEDASNNNVSLQYTINSLTANADAGTVTIDGNTGGIAVMNVLANDLANCTNANLINVRITPVSSTHPGVTLDYTNVSVAPGTPTGTYSLVYRICDMMNTVSCTLGTVTVKVINTNVPMSVTPFPNPYTDVINFRVISPVSGKANLVLYDNAGKRIAVIKGENVEAGVEKVITYQVHPAQRMFMVYKVTIGNETIEGKLVPAF